MLLSLYLENYALIEKQTIEFGEGFNVITGETGAGKSIIVGALSLIMGERASTDLIKSGKQRAILEAVFDIKHRHIPGYEQEDILIVTRELAINGRNLIKLNGRVVTQNDLRQVTRYLLDIHGQHQHQLLIDPENHLEILDLFIDTDLKNTLRLAYTNYQEIKHEYDLLLQSKDLRQEEKDFLKFQLEELETIKPQKGEYNLLVQEKSRLEAYTEIASAINEVKGSIYQVQDLLQNNRFRLNSVANKENALRELAEQAETLELNFEDFKEKLQDYAEKLEFNPTRLDEINERLDALNKLKRKHLKRPLSEEEDVGELLANKQKELTELLNNIEFSDEKLLDLQKKLEKAEKEYLDIAKELSALRKKTAQEISTKIVNSLKELKMNSVQFAVNFAEKSFSPNGIDQVEFMISPNPGEPLKPLSKIASGGELSRTMLAIKDILLDRDLVSSMVFDEIDTGIGGETANAIAKKISAISKKHQVICVTHLAQIAAVADHHILIKKEVQAGTTHVSAHILNNEQKEAEIARMLSGRITETTRAHARELLRA